MGKRRTIMVAAASLIPQAIPVEFRNSRDSCPSSVLSGFSQLLRVAFLSKGCAAVLLRNGIACVV